MINKTNKEKVKKFYQVLLKIQPSSGKDIGLILIEKETLADLISLTPNSNQTATFELDKNTYITEFIEDLAEALKRKKMVFLRLHDYLDPSIYNQLYLIYKAGRMDFPKLEKDIVFDVPKESCLILVSTDEEIEKLNYKNLFNIVGPVLRL